MRWGLIAVLGGAVFASTPARAEQSKAMEKRFDLRFGVSILWSENAASTALYGKHSSIGLLPLEIGVGVRLTDQIALAAIGRAGVFHAGVGIELAVTTADWSQDGIVFRVAPMILSDGLTCALFGDPSPGEKYCNSARYLMGELGVQYRWAFRGSSGISLGIVFNAGALRLNGYWGATTARAAGVILPRLQVEF
jgi:hypothetical protein